MKSIYFVFTHAILLKQLVELKAMDGLEKPLEWVDGRLSISQELQAQLDGRGTKDFNAVSLDGGIKFYKVCGQQRFAALEKGINTAWRDDLLVLG